MSNIIPSISINHGYGTNNFDILNPSSVPVPVPGAVNFGGFPTGNLPRPSPNTGSQLANPKHVYPFPIITYGSKDNDMFEGELIFTESDFDNDGKRLYHMKSLIQLNKKLYDEWYNQYGKLEKDEEISNVTDAIHTEKEYQTACNMLNNGHYEHILKDNPNLKNKMIKRLKKASDKKYNYLSQTGILRKWGLQAVLNNSKRTDVGGNMVKNGYDSLEVLNGVINGRCKIFDIFPGADKNDDLYLILKRKKTKNGKYGAFAFFPCVTTTGGSPTTQEREYEDLKSDELVLGKCIYVGRVIAVDFREPNQNIQMRCANTIGNRSIGLAKGSYSNCTHLTILFKNK